MEEAKPSKFSRFMDENPVISAISTLALGVMYLFGGLAAAFGNPVAGGVLVSGVASLVTHFGVRDLLKWGGVALAKRKMITRIATGAVFAGVYAAVTLPPSHDRPKASVEKGTLASPSKELDGYITSGINDLSNSYLTAADRYIMARQKVKNDKFSSDRYITCASAAVMASENQSRLDAEKIFKESGAAVVKQKLIAHYKHRTAELDKIVQTGRVEECVRPGIKLNSPSASPK